MMSTKVLVFVSKISMQRLDSGTRCSTFAFIRSAGIVHVAAGRSTSPHVAKRTSPDRAAVSTPNSNASLVPSHTLAALHAPSCLSATIVVYIADFTAIYWFTELFLFQFLCLYGRDGPPV